MTRLITSIRATTSVIKKSYKIQKIAYFTYFDQKNTHISGCKIVHKCTIATITVHICTVTIVCAFNILIISDSLFLFSLSLFSICKTNPPSHVLSSSDTHTPTTQNKKSTIKIQNQPQNQQKKSTTRTKSLD